MKISAEKFKAQCLKLMDNVHTNGEPIVITKYGKPVAKLVPYAEKNHKPLFEYLKGSITYQGDIISPLDVKWNANE